MGIKIQSIRFSRSFFGNYESCVKWLSDHEYDFSQYEEFDDYFAFGQIAKDKFTETSLQPFKLDSGVEAVVGLAIETQPNFNNIQDADSVSIPEKSNAVSQEVAYDALKTSYLKQLETFVDVLSKLSEVTEPIKAMKDSLLTELKQVNKTSVELVNKNELQDNIDEGQIQIFTPIIKTKDEKIVFGEVLVPNTVDGQEHVYSEKEVEKAAHFWMKEYGQMGEMHSNMLSDDQINILETYVAPMGFEFEKLDGKMQKVKKGTWLLKVFVKSDELWDKVKNGDLNGFSIGGLATVEDIK